MRTQSLVRHGVHTPSFPSQVPAASHRQDGWDGTSYVPAQDKEVR